MNAIELKQKEREEVVSKLADKLEIKNTEDIISFGLEAQKKISSFSDQTLKNIKAKELEETGKLVSELLSELNSLELGRPKRGILGFFRKKAFDLQELKSQYDSVSTNIKGIVNNIQQHQLKLTEDAKTLEDLYQVNKGYFQEICLYIAIGEKKAQKLRENDLKELAEIADRTKDPMDIQNLKDMDNLITRLDKKVYDLELTRTVSMQMAPQIRMIQNANNTMVEKLQSTVNNTIPLWKSQMLIAIGTMHSKDAAETQKLVSDMTNKLLVQNSESMKDTIVAIHEESERGIVDMETLRETNKNLIESIQAVQEIQKVGRENRIQAKKELESLQKELISKVKELAQSDINEKIERSKTVLKDSDIEQLKDSFNLDKELEKLKEDKLVDSI